MERPDNTIFECVAGSHSYGLNTPTSDIDIRGIFIQPMGDRLSLHKRVDEMGGKSQDTKYYELAKFMHLASGCNPNIIELLWTPEDCIRHMDKRMRLLIENRHLFITKRAFHTFTGYAYAQIKKARGQNKYVNNPQPEERPTREDFCYIVHFDPDIDYRRQRPTEFPMRPVSLEDSHIDLSHCHAASVEHVGHVYRLYDYGRSAKGVFRGDNTVVCDTIPKEDEWKRIVGLLIYDKNAWERTLKEWKSYWEWRKCRNEARWKGQDGEDAPVDWKNMMHCTRLLLSGESILLNGEPIVRFTDDDHRQYLMSIRQGNEDYDEVMANAEYNIGVMKQIKEEMCSLPNSPDVRAIDKLFRQILEM